MQTTLNKIRAHHPCAAGWMKLLQHLGKTKADDEPVRIITILDSNGLDDALWCLRAVEGHDREIRLYAVWCARQVQHLMTDPHSIAAIDVAERYANNFATQYDLDAAQAVAGDAAWAAAWAAARDAARAAAGNAAWAAAGNAAWNAVRAAAWAARAAARDAAGNAAWAAAGNAAWNAARDAAWASAWAAAGNAQAARLREVCAEIGRMETGNEQ